MSKKIETKFSDKELEEKFNALSAATKSRIRNQATAQDVSVEDIMRGRESGEISTRPSEQKANGAVRNWTAGREIKVPTKKDLTTIQRQIANEEDPKKKKKLISKASDIRIRLGLAKCQNKRLSGEELNQKIELIKEKYPLNYQGRSDYVNARTILARLKRKNTTAISQEAQSSGRFCEYGVQINIESMGEESERSSSSSHPSNTLQEACKEMNYKKRSSNSSDSGNDRDDIFFEEESHLSRGVLYGLMKDRARKGSIDI